MKKKCSLQNAIKFNLNPSAIFAASAKVSSQFLFAHFFLLHRAISGILSSANENARVVLLFCSLETSCNRAVGKFTVVIPVCVDVTFHSLFFLMFGNSPRNEWIFRRKFNKLSTSRMKLLCNCKRGATTPCDTETHSTSSCRTQSFFYFLLMFMFPTRIHSEFFFINFAILSARWAATRERDSSSYIEHGIHLEVPSRT